MACDAQRGPAVDDQHAPAAGAVAGDVEPAGDRVDRRAARDQAERHAVDRRPAGRRRRRRGQQQRQAAQHGPRRPDEAGGADGARRARQRAAGRGAGRPPLDVG